jgi:hypothetical protein
MSSTTNTPFNDTAVLEPLPSSPQAIAVLIHLQGTNPMGYLKMQKDICNRLKNMDDAKDSYSFTVDSEKYDIEEICCSTTVGGVRSLSFTRISELDPWSKKLTGMDWRLGAKTLFGHPGTKMVPVQTLIIDIKKVDGEYFIANITFPPENDILKTAGGRAVSFSHLVGALANPKEMDKAFNLNGRDGISIKSGLGMCGMVLEHVFQEGGDFVRLGDYAVKLAKNSTMPPVNMSLSSIYDIDMDELRKKECTCESDGVDDKCWTDQLPFMTTVPGTNSSFKSFGVWRDPYEPREYPNDDTELTDIDYYPDEFYFKPNIILTLDGPDKGNKNNLNGGTGLVSTHWTEDPDIWEMLLVDFASVCSRSI